MRGFAVHRLILVSSETADTAVRALCATHRGVEHEESGKGGVALSVMAVMAVMVVTEVTASAEESFASADDTVDAIGDVTSSVVDTAIDVSSADATVSTGAGVSVDLSSDASEGISIGGRFSGDLEVGLPFAKTADDATIVDGVMVYDNNNGSTTTPLVHEDGCVQILTTITGATAPTEYTYVIDADSWGRPRTHRRWRCRRGGS